MQVPTTTVYTRRKEHLVLTCVYTYQLLYYLCKLLLLHMLQLRRTCLLGRMCPIQLFCWYAINITNITNILWGASILLKTAKTTVNLLLLLLYNIILLRRLLLLLYLRLLLLYGILLPNILSTESDITRLYAQLPHC